VLIELSIAWVIALNIIAWLVIQFGLAWSFTQLGAERFDPHNFFARTKNWERDGRFYERALGIKRWKDKLPDASRMFRGGFAKANLQTASPEYLERFLRETWRGELVHWLALSTLPLFCIWNPWWGVGVNAVVALAVNFPCILALRYNRARFLRVIERHQSQTQHPSNSPKP
jgi:glycosyl-4,4'-diaponeurosporenoate acyltransferase